MTNSEFILEFNTIYNNISSNQAPGLDIYEISLFCTQAQEALVASMYGGQISSAFNFENTESLRRYLDSLVITKEIAPIQKPSDTTKPYLGLSDQSYFVPIPQDTWFITYEAADITSTSKCLNNKQLDVLPITLDEYHKLKRNPFRQANDNRVLRLDVGDTYQASTTETDKLIELIGYSDYTISKYKVRYIKTLSPIIVGDLTSLNVSINGIQTETPCKLHEALHRTIIQNAAALAAASFSQSK